MKTKYTISVLMIFLFIASITIYAMESKQETVKFENIKELDVSNVTGSINITGWDKDYVEVTYTKKAQYEDDLEDIDVDAVKKLSEEISQILGGNSSEVPRR